MYHIKVPQIAVDVAAARQFSGTSVCCAVEVDWPEFKLTDDQIFANVTARLDGRPEPFPDRHIITLELPYAQLAGLKG